MMDKKIAIIGIGNMGSAIAAGLIKHGIDMSNLILIDQKTATIEHKLYIYDHITYAKDADIIILAVKPQQMHDLLLGMKVFFHDQLLISIAAGITMQSIESILGNDTKIVRVMPNLNAKVGKSMSVWTANRNVIEEHKRDIQAILSTIGAEMYISNEDKMNTVTAISGSGPAYLFYFCELLIDAAVHLGFSTEEANTLVKETLIGSADLVVNTEVNFTLLREQVTSKRGTTEAAIASLDKNKFKTIILEAVRQAERRAAALAY